MSICFRKRLKRSYILPKLVGHEYMYQNPAYGHLWHNTSFTDPKHPWMQSIFVLLLCPFVEIFSHTSVLKNTSLGNSKPVRMFSSVFDSVIHVRFQRLTYCKRVDYVAISKQRRKTLPSKYLFTALSEGTVRYPGHVHVAAKIMLFLW